MYKLLNSVVRSQLVTVVSTKGRPSAPREGGQWKKGEWGTPMTENGIMKACGMCRMLTHVNDVEEMKVMNTLFRT